MEFPPFSEFLGIDHQPAGDGEARSVLDVKPHHLNRRGVVHGGVLSALLDSTLGAAVISSMPKEWWCATISLSVQFISGGRGDRIVASGRVLRRGVQVAFASGEVRDSAGRLVAAAEGSWHIWPHRPGVAHVAAGAHVVVRGTGERVRVGKIVAVGRNYAEHVVEMGGDPDVDPPVLFTKPPSAIVPDGGTVRIPEGAGSVHHEVELVAVIGKAGRRIPEEDALDHVLGYAVGLDMTLRDLQGEAKKRGEPWAVAKGFDTSAPVSPVAPRDEVGDGSGLDIRVAVDGELRQQGSTSQMIHPVARLVAYASRLWTLERGDLLFTGTPSGVGPVVPGNRMVAEIESVGRLEVGVATEGDPPD